MTMEGRKVLWLGCAILCGLTGCSWFDKRDKHPGLAVSPPKSQREVRVDTPVTNVVTRDKSDKDEPKQLNAKPATCVSMGDFKAQIATDASRPAGERELFGQQAKQAYRRALEQDPKYVPAWMGLGTVCESMGDKDEAINHYRTVLKIDPKHVPAHIGVARIYENNGQRDAAMSTYKAATAAMPRDASLWHEQGLCYGRAKQFDEALPCLERAANLRPTNNDYNKSVGFMLARMGRGDEALPWLTKAMPEADARYNIARMLEHIGQEQASQTQLALALKADPNHIPSLKRMNEPMPATQAPVNQPATAPTVRTTAYRPNDEASPAPAVRQASTLPSRPSVAAAADQPRPVPLIPIVSDSWEGKPTLTPSLTPALFTAAPPANKEPPKPRAKPALSFEENP